MEEKERYSWYNHSTEEIYDNKENIVFVGAITVLNQQNRRIWELVEENKKLKEQLSKKEEIYKHIMSGEHIPANIAEKSLKLSEQSQKQLAIEEFEKILSKLSNIENTLINCGNGKEDAICWFVRLIDDQIKELKGE